MKTVVATEMKNRLGQYLADSLVEPILIEKSGHPLAVLLSLSEYERLQAVEDRLWGEQAKKALESGFVGYEESLKRIQGRLDAET